MEFTKYIVVLLLISTLSVYSRKTDDSTSEAIPGIQATFSHIHVESIDDDDNLLSWIIDLCFGKDTKPTDLLKDDDRFTNNVQKILNKLTSENVKFPSPTKFKIETPRMDIFTFIRGGLKLFFPTEDLGRIVRAIALPELVTYLFQIIFGNSLYAMFTSFLFNILLRIISRSPLESMYFIIFSLLRWFSTGILLYKDKTSRQTSIYLLFIRGIYFSVIELLIHTKFNYFIVYLMIIVACMIYVLIMFLETVKDQNVRTIGVISLSLESILIFTLLADLSLKDDSITTSSLIINSILLLCTTIAYVLTLNIFQIDYLINSIHTFSLKYTVYNYATNDLINFKADQFKQDFSETLYLFFSVYVIISLLLVIFIFVTIGYYYAHYLDLKRRTDLKLPEDEILFKYMFYHVGLGLKAMNPRFYTFHIDDPGRYNWVFALLSLMKIYILVTSIYNIMLLFILYSLGQVITMMADDPYRYSRPQPKQESEDQFRRSLQIDNDYLVNEENPYIIKEAAISSINSSIKIESVRNIKEATVKFKKPTGTATGVFISKRHIIVPKHVSDLLGSLTDESGFAIDDIKIEIHNFENRRKTAQKQKNKNSDMLAKAQTNGNQRTIVKYTDLCAENDDEISYYEKEIIDARSRIVQAKDTLHTAYVDVTKHDETHQRCSIKSIKPIPFPDRVTPSEDLFLIEFNSDVTHIEAVPISNRALRPTDRVIASDGNDVRFLNKTRLNKLKSQFLHQTNTKPGESGMGYFNTEGELIAVHSGYSKNDGRNIGIYIPPSVSNQVSKELGITRKPKRKVVINNFEEKLMEPLIDSLNFIDKLIDVRSPILLFED